MTGFMIGLVSMSFGLLETFAAGAVSLKPPLVYEYNRMSPSAIESEVIETAGTVKSISAFWNSKGEVTAEVSANAGVAYTPIINGQLLKEGFIPGNQLRFKIKIGENGVLSRFALGYEDSSGVSRHYQNNDLSKFKYRKALQISGSNEELFNYPVKIIIGLNNSQPQAPDSRCLESGKILLNTGSQPDFKDIRFTAADSQTLIPYYVENIVAGVYAKIWVKVPQIPAGGTVVYLYYGNKDAADLSDPEDVFLFYDDFSADKLDEKKWQVRPEFEKRLEVHNGYVGLKDCSIISRGLKMRKGIFEFKAKSEANAAIQAIAKGFVNKQLGVTSEQMVYSSAYPGAEHTIAINDVAKLNIGKPIEPMKDYIYKVTVNNDGISFERYSENFEKQAEIKFLDTYQVNDGYIGLKAASSPLDGGSVYFDWVRVRPYTEFEPKAVVIDRKD